MDSSRGGGGSWFVGAAVAAVVVAGFVAYRWTAHQRHAAHSAAAAAPPAGAASAAPRWTPLTGTRSGRVTYSRGRLGQDLLITDSNGDWVFIPFDADGGPLSVIFGLGCEPPERGGDEVWVKAGAASVGVSLTGGHDVLVASHEGIMERPVAVSRARVAERVEGLGAGGTSLHALLGEFESGAPTTQPAAR